MTSNEHFFINNLSSTSNLYKILELPPNATKYDIKKAYKKLILKHHPDKSNEKSYEKFLEIKNAYDILYDDEKRIFYDKVNKSIYSKEIEIFNFIDKNKIKNLLLNFINSSDIDKIILILIKKKKIFNQNYINELIFNNNLIIDIIDINFTIDFTLTELWYGCCKNISYKRITREIFNELIYPFDNKQIYEGEGEKIKFNNKILNGNINININITDTKINNEQYFIYKDDLYLIINSKRIYENKFKIKFIDGNEYKFNLDKLSYIENELGKVYVKKNFGLINSSIDYKNNESDITNTFSHRNLFFIFVI